jgi:hypothetical protein
MRLVIDAAGAPLIGVHVGPVVRGAALDDDAVLATVLAPVWRPRAAGPARHTEGGIAYRLIELEAALRAATTALAAVYRLVDHAAGAWVEHAADAVTRAAAEAVLAGARIELRCDEPAWLAGLLIRPS